MSPAASLRIAVALLSCVRCLIFRRPSTVGSIRWNCFIRLLASITPSVLTSGWLRTSTRADLFEEETMAILNEINDMSIRDTVDRCFEAFIGGHCYPSVGAYLRGA